MVFSNLLKLIIVYMPGALGRKLRYWFYKNKLKKCGRNVIIDEGVIVENPKWISIDDNVWIGRYTTIEVGAIPFSPEKDIVKRKTNPYIRVNEGELTIGAGCHIGAYNIIQAHGGIKIGKNVTTSAFVKIYSLSNIPNSPNNHKQITYANCMVGEGEQVAYIIGPIEIEDGVWIGLDCVVLSGIKIGKYSFVKSKSLVLSDIEENSVVGGNPARFLRKRFKNYD
jgi:acetyltransferase-like isoleucine patch superfamily enzyme